MLVSITAKKAGPTDSIKTKPNKNPFNNASNICGKIKQNN
jgi:hypothetical protein